VYGARRTKLKKGGCYFLFRRSDPWITPSQRAVRIALCYLHKSSAAANTRARAVPNPEPSEKSVAIGRKHGMALAHISRPGSAWPAGRICGTLGSCRRENGVRFAALFERVRPMPRLAIRVRLFVRVFRHSAPVRAPVDAYNPDICQAVVAIKSWWGGGTTPDGGAGGSLEECSIFLLGRQSCRRMGASWETPNKARFKMAIREAVSFKHTANTNRPRWRAGDEWLRCRGSGATALDRMHKPTK